MSSSSDPSAQSPTESAVSSIKEGYPAAEILKVLLRTYAIDFPKYHRNVNASQALWEEWKTIYEGILLLMDTVQHPDSTYQVQWDSFVKYSAAIGALEEHLLSLQADFSGNEISAIPTEDGVSATITFIGSWFHSRQQLINASDSLQAPHYDAFSTQTRDVQAKIRTAVRTDDLQIMRELANKIGEHSLDDDDILEITEDEEFVSDVKGQVDAISSSASNLTETERMGQIVFALMGIYTPFIAHDKDEDDAHVISKDVWVAVKKFADQTAAFADGSTVSLETFKGQWDEYLVVLTKTLNAFAMQMVTLMRQASQVRRPFFGRTVGVIRMWEVLTTSEDVKKVEKASERKALIDLLNTTTTEFVKTSESIQSFNDAADLDATINERKKAYTDLTGDLEVMINKYAPGKWTAVHQAYTAGATTDDTHLAKFREFVAKAAATMNDL